MLHLQSRDLSALGALILLATSCAESISTPYDSGQTGSDAAGATDSDGASAEDSTADPDGGVEDSRADTSSLDVDGTTEPPVAPRLGGPPDALAVDHLPALGGPILSQDAYGPDPDLGVDSATRHLLIAVSSDASVADVNGALDAADLDIVGSLGPAGVLLVALSEASTLADRNLAMQRLDASPAISDVARDLTLRGASLPRGDRPLDWWGAPAGDNWAFEYIRAPHAWSLRRPLEEDHPLDLEPGAPVVTVGLVDRGFKDHEQLRDILRIVRVPGANFHYEPPESPLEHGTAVAGVIAGRWQTSGERAELGGVSPYVDLVGANNAGWHLDSPAVDIAGFWGVLRSAAELLLRRRPRIINISMAMNWHATCYETGTILSRRRRCDPTGRAPESGCDASTVRVELSAAARVFARFVESANREGPVLFVIAAGNDSGPLPPAGTQVCDTDPPAYAGLGDFPADLASPMAQAAVHLPTVTEHSIVVEALRGMGRWSATRATVSNSGSRGVAAPGRNVGVLRGGGPESSRTVATGTSYAAPLVTGAAAYLVAVQPDLTNSELKMLLTSGATTQDVMDATGARGLDLFAALLAIDDIRPGQRVRRMLADIDDGTDDGVLRVVRDDDGWPLSCDIDDGPPDGTVDIRDLRRCRDATIHADPLTFQPPLDGRRSVKLDLNEDERIENHAFDEGVFARCNFNGDAQLDLGSWPTSGVERRDLWLLEEVFTPTAPQWFERAELAALSRSADVHVRAACAGEPIRVSLRGEAPAGEPPADVRSETLEGLELEGPDTVLTTPRREGVSLSWRLAAGGPEHTIEVGSLEPGEDRVVRLDMPVEALRYTLRMESAGATALVQQIEQRFVTAMTPSPPPYGTPTCEDPSAPSADRTDRNLVEVRTKETMTTGDTTTVKLTVSGPEQAPEIYMLEPLVEDPMTGEWLVLKPPHQLGPGSGAFPIIPELSATFLRCGRHSGQARTGCLAAAGFSRGDEDSVDGRRCINYTLGLSAMASIEACLPTDCELSQLPLPLRYRTYAAGTLQQTFTLSDVEVLSGEDLPLPIPADCRVRFPHGPPMCAPPT